MNRRYFLGAALTALATPVVAKPSSNHNRARILRFRHLHTDERIEVTYRIGDQYQRPALQKLNHFFRDFRTGDTAAMDPKLFDLLYDIQIKLGDDGARYDILSGYRSNHTNQMLRAKSRGVAKNSLHLTGQALDVRFPDLPTRRIRDAAIELERGGVGYYPRSNFVHLDTGTVRRWGA
ncbi:MAG: DUF882 domain-containing protein [Sphingobacteriia bacterium]|nr:DUF882 domain-containing protein [Sphingobacteriia bacterium]NCC40333.1 DUF882 domain-containing protein [Gammaproteobacteria bacterium]